MGNYLPQHSDCLRPQDAPMREHSHMCMHRGELQHRRCPASKWRALRLFPQLCNGSPVHVPAGTLPTNHSMLAPWTLNVCNCNKGKDGHGPLLPARRVVQTTSACHAMAPVQLSAGTLPTWPQLKNLEVYIKPGNDKLCGEVGEPSPRGLKGLEPPRVLGLTHRSSAPVSNALVQCTWV